MCDLGVKKKQVKLYLEGNPRQFGLFMFCFNFFFFFHLPVCLKVGGWQRFRWGITRRRKKNELREGKVRQHTRNAKTIQNWLWWIVKKDRSGDQVKFNFVCFTNKFFLFVGRLAAHGLRDSSSRENIAKTDKKKILFFVTNRQTHTHTHYHDWSNKRKYSFRLTTLFPFQKRKKKSNNKERIAVQRLKNKNIRFTVPSIVKEDSSPTARKEKKIQIFREKKNKTNKSTCYYRTAGIKLRNDSLWLLK